MHRLSISTCIGLSTVSLAAADPRPEIGSETIIVVDDVPEGNRDRDRALGDAPFVTVLHPDDHPATATIADAIATAVGAQTRSLGGLGAFQSISIRGASPGHTVVLIDGVPLARIAAVTTDLGRFQLDAFGRVDLYRGAVPVELGGAGVGGAVDLITRLGPGERGERLRASAGFGSYGARHVRAHYGDAHGERVLSSTTIGYTGATGDYDFFDNHGTQLNKSDDTYEVRRNNGFDQLDLASRIGLADRPVAGGLRVAYKDQGLPGTTTRPAMLATLATLDVIGDARGEVELGAASLRGLAYGLLSRQRLHDPDGELGLGAQQRGYLTLSGGGSATWQRPLARHRGVIGLEGRAERFREEDLGGVQTSVTGDRVGGAVLAAIDLALAPDLVITPAIRLDVVRTAPAAMTVGPDAYVALAPRRDVVPSPRLTGRLAVGGDLAIKGSGGWYVRLPTLLELFGNRGFILGSPELLPERGPSADLGIVWAPASGTRAIDRILVETSMFATRARDTIAFITSAGYVTRAANIGRSQTHGVELVGSARLARAVTLTTSYTRLASEQISGDVSKSGRAIPRTPEHLLYARADLSRRIAARDTTMWLDASYQATSYLDAANLGRVPGRTLVGAGASVEIAGGVAVAVSVANLIDKRVVDLPLDPPPSPTFTSTPTALADVAGFPLPGRSFYLSLHWTY